MCLHGRLEQQDLPVGAAEASEPPQPEEALTLAELQAKAQALQAAGEQASLYPALEDVRLRGYLESRGQAISAGEGKDLGTELKNVKLANKSFLLLSQQVAMITLFLSKYNSTIMPLSAWFFSKTTVNHPPLLRRPCSSCAVPLQILSVIT